jgi:hypothetical protein
MAAVLKNDARVISTAVHRGANILGAHHRFTLASPAALRNGEARQPSRIGVS